MFSELQVPFDEAKFPSNQLEEVNGGHLLTAVSVNYSGVFISLNFNDLKAGDVVLYREQAEDRFDPIVAYQLLLRHEAQAARWRHIGILVARCWFGMRCLSSTSDAVHCVIGSPNPAVSQSSDRIARLIQRSSP